MGAFSGGSTHNESVFVVEAKKYIGKTTTKSMETPQIDFFLSSTLPSSLLDEYPNTSWIDCTE